MQRHPARLFGPGLAAGGEPIELELTDTRLGVVGRHDVDVAFDEVRLTLAGFGLDEWQLAWDGGEGQFVAHIADRSALTRLGTLPPAGLKPQIAAIQLAQGRRQRRTALVWSLVGLIVLLPLIALGAFVWQAERIAGWVAERIPVEQEKQLGELVFAKEAAQLKLVEQGPAVDAVRQIGTRLTQGSRYTYQFKVAQSKEVNAFAVPGGIVVVYTGLLAKAASAEELAGVLAHEVQHIERRHSLKAMVHGLGLSALAALVFGDVSGGAAAGMAQQLAGLSFSRDQETDADLQGLNALQRAGIAPEGMLRFYRKLAEKDGVAPPELLSTHPASEGRFAALETALKQKGKWQSTPLPYDWQAVTASLK